MSNTNLNKRKLDSDNSDEKNVKLSRIGSNVDIEELKNTLRQEISREFEGRIAKLKSEIRVLKSEKLSIDNPFAKSTSEKEEEPKEVPKDTKNSISNGVGASNTVPHFATPTNSFTSATVQTPKDPVSQKQTPKHVFGVTTSFGSNVVLESMKTRKDVFSSLPSTSAPESESPKPVGTTSSFGSGSFGSGSFGSSSKFGKAFKSSLNKKSFLDGNDSEKEKEKEKESTEIPKSTAQQQYKQIDLNPVDEIKTGEENEKSHFSCTSKLFELDLGNISEGWKERGLGPLHLNQSNEDPELVRIVMRSQGLLRVILNMKITPETKLLKGLESSLSPGKFLRFNTLNEKGKPVQYMLKFGSQNLRDELVDKTTSLQETFKKDPKHDVKPSTTGVKWL